MSCIVTSQYANEPCPSHRKYLHSRVFNWLITMFLLCNLFVLSLFLSTFQSTIVILKTQDSTYLSSHLAKQHIKSNWLVAEKYFDQLRRSVELTVQANRYTDDLKEKLNNILTDYYKTMDLVEKSGKPDSSKLKDLPEQLKESLAERYNQFTAALDDLRRNGELEISKFIPLPEKRNQIKKPVRSLFKRSLDSAKQEVKREELEVPAFVKRPKKRRVKKRKPLSRALYKSTEFPEKEGGKKDWDCVPPCGVGTGDEKQSYKECSLEEYSLPIICPIQDIYVAEFQDIILNCNAVFELPEETTVRWKLSKNGRDNDLEIFKNIPKEGGLTYQIRRVTMDQDTTYSCEIDSEEEGLLIRKFFYLNITEFVPNMNLQELFEKMDHSNATFEPIVEPKNNSSFNLDDLFDSQIPISTGRYILYISVVGLGSLLITMIFGLLYIFATDVEKLKF